MSEQAKVPSIRLTNSDRDNILGAAISGAFEARDKALADEADTLARRCYESVFPAATRKAAKSMPEGWLSLDCCLRFNVGGLDVQLALVGDGLPVPHRARGHCQRLGAITDADLIEAVTAHLSAWENRKAESARAKASLKGLLYSISTLRALHDIWPEGEPYYQHIAGRISSATLPVPQVAELNAILGLPMREAA